MNTIIVVYGTRPEAIKMAPLVKELRQLKHLNTVLVCSGQHKEMLEGIMSLWNLVPDITLTPKSNSDQSSAIPNLMIDLEKVFKDLSPKIILVQGDTATATAAALQAHALRIPVGHVEAGLRSGDLWNPWPEESNRKIIDAIASLHFAPTMSAAQNLVSEGYADSTYTTGNTVVDATLYASNLLNNQPEVRTKLESILDFSLAEDYILFTQHRREGFGEGQTSVFNAIVDLAKLGERIVFPVHLNPHVRTKVDEMLKNQPGIYLIEPQNYLSFLELIRNSRMVISDSGGLQEEVPTFGKEVLITRLKTERPEIIESGFGRLVGYSSEAILEGVTKIKSRSKAIERNPFGDGKSAEIIRKHIEEFLEI